MFARASPRQMQAVYGNHQKCQVLLRMLCALPRYSCCIECADAFDEEDTNAILQQRPCCTLPLRGTKTHPTFLVDLTCSLSDTVQMVGANSSREVHVSTAFSRLTTSIPVLVLIQAYLDMTLLFGSVISHAHRCLCLSLSFSHSYSFCLSLSLSLSLSFSQFP